MDWRVPLVEIEVTDADVEAVLDCLRSGWLTMGPRTQRLEEALAGRIGVKHAIAVSSGTAALHLACRAVGLGPGDEAIVPDLTFVATAHAPRYLGADVVLCDAARPGDPALDIASVEAAITPRTKAVLAVHMWGYPAAVDALRRLCDEHGLTLIEDCAEGSTRAARAVAWSARSATSAASASSPKSSWPWVRAASSPLTTTTSRRACGPCARTR